MIDSIVVMNVKEREREGIALMKILRQAVAFTGREIPIYRSMDDGSMGIWKNFKRCMRASISPDERYRLLIQDYMTFSRSSLAKINYILCHAPENQIVTFYCPTNKAYIDAYNKGHRILKTKKNAWTPVCAYPIQLMNDIIAWCDYHVDESYKHDDTRIHFYMQNHRAMNIYAHLPSLSQHLGAFRLTVGTGGKIGRYERVSSFYQPECKVFEVDWENEFANPYLDLKGKVKIPPEYILHEPEEN